MNSELFLIDSNSLIEPYNTFYSPDLAPSFWEQMKLHIESGTIAILDMVKNEILKGRDGLTLWLENIKIGHEIDHRQSSILLTYRVILQSIQKNPCYHPVALREWSRDTVADPWLIAAASVYGYTIITFEKAIANLSPKQPTKKPKIPNFSAEFGVKAENLYYMMRALKFRLSG